MQLLLLLLLLEQLLNRWFYWLLDWLSRPLTRLHILNPAAARLELTILLRRLNTNFSSSLLALLQELRILRVILLPADILLNEIWLFFSFHIIRRGTILPLASFVDKILRLRSSLRHIRRHFQRQGRFSVHDLGRWALLVVDLIRRRVLLNVLRVDLLWLLMVVVWVGCRSLFNGFEFFLGDYVFDGVLLKSDHVSRFHKIR